MIAKIDRNPDFDPYWKYTQCLRELQSVCTNIIDGRADWEDDDGEFSDYLSELKPKHKSCTEIIGGDGLPIKPLPQYIVDNSNNIL